MQTRLARLEHECEFLSRIGEKHRAYLGQTRIAALHAHSAAILAHAEYAEKLATAQERLTRLKEKNASEKIEFDQSAARLDAVARLIAEVPRSLARS